MSWDHEDMRRFLAELRANGLVPGGGDAAERWFTALGESVNFLEARVPAGEQQINALTARVVSCETLIAELTDRVALLEIGGGGSDILTGGLIHLRGLGAPVASLAPSPGLGSSLPSRLPFSSGVATYYVNASTGDDSRSAAQAQSPSTPWRTINKAVNTVTAAGSIIELADGTYQAVGGSYALIINNRAVPGGTTNPITIRAATPGGAVITGSAMGGVFTIGCWINNSSGWRIDGIRFSVQGLGSIAVQLENSTRVEFNRCTFVDTGEISVKTKGAPGTPATDIWFHACKFAPSGTKTWQRSGSHWVGAPVSTQFGAGLDTGSGPGGLTGYYGTRGTHYMYLGQCVGAETGQGGSLRNVVANCLFIGNTPGRHIELGPQAVETYIVNNTFYGLEPGTYTNTDDLSYRADYAGTGVEFFANVSAFATRGARIVNNIFSELQGHACYGSPGFALTGNEVFNNLAFSLSNGLGQMESTSDDFHQTRNGNVIFSEPGGQRPNADPLFVAPSKIESANLHLQSGSPARNVADPAYCPTHDFDGVARDSTPDLGAYAFV